MVTRRQFLGVGTSAALGAGSVAAIGPPRSGSDDPKADTGNSRGPPPKALVAGSLLGVADDVSSASVEAHGSLAVRRLIVENARDPDAVALADPSLFEGISPRMRLFATNALVLAYDPRSPHAEALQQDWTSALTRDGVRLGRTDPETDPLGYRTVLALKLAERKGMAERSEILSQSTVLPETGIVRAVAGGKLDAAFVYRSMAVEADIPFVDLPAAIDFSDPAHSETYASVSINLEDRMIRGAPIRYAATAMTEDGESWVNELVQGQERLRKHGFSVPEEYPQTVTVKPE